MDAIEQLAKLLDESKAEMVFRHCDVKAAFTDLREQLAGSQQREQELRELLAVLFGEEWEQNPIVQEALEEK